MWKLPITNEAILLLNLISKKGVYLYYFLKLRGENTSIRAPLNGIRALLKESRVHIEHIAFYGRYNNVLIYFIFFISFIFDMVSIRADLFVLFVFFLFLNNEFIEIFKKNEKIKNI